MKTFTILPAVTAFLFLLTNCGETSGPETGEAEDKADSTGLPGDHFSLEGALEMFKDAGSPEEFEKELNTENNYVNNLDLNADGKIDYIRVIDNTQEDAHAIVLQAVLGKDDAQDVAVIEIDKTSDDSALLQMVGDEDLFGSKNIVEPLAENKTSPRSMASFGPLASVDVTVEVNANVWLWPCVAFIYEPDYVVWVSPWYWGILPGVVEPLASPPLGMVPCEMQALQARL